MGYIGNEPTTGHFPVQTNLVGPGPTYTLDRAPATAGAIEVSVSGVLQPTTAYSVSGTTLTMAGVAAGIPIFIRYLGETLSLPTPADGSVTDTKIGAGAVTDAKIAGMAATKLTGTIAGARFPATLPAVDGSALTNIVHTPADNSVTGGKLDISLLAGDTMYASATDTLAKLAKGTAGQLLTMNAGATAPEWAAPAGGGGLWEYIGTANFSAVSDVLITGFTTDYRIEVYDLGFSSSGPNLKMFTTGDNTNFKTDQYRYSTIMPTGNTGFDNWYQNTVGQIYLTNSGVGNDFVNSSSYFEIESIDAANTSAAPMWIWRGAFVNQSGDNRYVTGGGQRCLYGAAPHNSSGIKLNISSGNMTGSYRKYKRITA